MNNIRMGLGGVLCFLGFNVSAQTQLELNQSSCSEFKKADARLNQIYQNVLSAHRNDKIFISRFKEAQRKWIAYRDAYEASMFIPEYYNRYGSVLPMCQCDFMVHLTDERIKQLKVWADGVEEGDSCGGSTLSE
jgi:uncharacterized protein YecT (DUF1311 family)